MSGCTECGFSATVPCTCGIAHSSSSIFKNRNRNTCVLALRRLGLPFVFVFLVLGQNCVHLDLSFPFWYFWRQTQFFHLSTNTSTSLIFKPPFSPSRPCSQFFQQTVLSLLHFIAVVLFPFFFFLVLCVQATLVPHNFIYPSHLYSLHFHSTPLHFTPLHRTHHSSNKKQQWSS